MGKFIALLLIGGSIIMSSSAAKPNENAELLAISLIAKWEGFSATPYKCPGGYQTIGYGFSDPVIVAKGVITRKDADYELGKIVRKDLALLRKHVSGLTPKQEAASVSLMYNIGRGAFTSSTFLKKLKAKDFVAARDEIKKWNHSNGRVLEGLTKRRNAEAAWI